MLKRLHEKLIGGMLDRDIANVLENPCSDPVEQARLETWMLHKLIQEEHRAKTGSPFLNWEDRIEKKDP